MSKKITLDEIQTKLNILTNNSVKILSKSYVNNNTNIDLLCSCGNTFQKTWTTINSKNAKIMCKECYANNRSEYYKKNINEFIDYMNNYGNKYLSGEYKDKYSLLSFQCLCGQIFETTWDRARDGKVFCNNCMRKHGGQLIRKYTLNEAKQAFKNFGFEMLEDNYNLVTDKILCKCPNGHLCSTSLSLLQNHKYGCKTCSILNRTGNKSILYKHGIEPYMYLFRNRLKPWKRQLLKIYNNTCPITGSKNVVVHHLLSFNIICENIFQQYNLLTNNMTINDFRQIPKYEEIIEEILNAHTLTIGIVISEKIHKEFHREYDYGNNTPSQFDEFIKKYYGVSLLDIQKGV